MGPIMEPYYEKGLAEGEARDEARGEARGEAKVGAKTLTLLLRRRFGELPASFQQRICAADAGDIRAWIRRASDAPDLELVFESAGPGETLAGSRS